MENTDCLVCVLFTKDLNNPANAAERPVIEKALREHQAAPHRIWRQAS